MQGTVSLAVALALPSTTTRGGSAFPQRILIMFLTFAVIFVPSAGQGLALTGPDRMPSTGAMFDKVLASAPDMPIAPWRSLASPSMTVVPQREARPRHGAIGMSGALASTLSNMAPVEGIRSGPGRASPCPAKVTKMTAKVRNMIRMRCGKALPPRVGVDGSAIATARETVPCIPLQALTSGRLAPGCRAGRRPADPDQAGHGE